MNKYPSPVDILEMKRRGYDADTIEKAEILSQRWMVAEGIRCLIRDAFKSVQLGNGIGLWEAQAIDASISDDEQASYRLKDEKLDWKKISINDLQQCHSSLSFFDAEGMRFHLPAYLMADLNGDDRIGLSFALTQNLHHANQQFDLLDLVQRNAVLKFLQFAKQESDYAFYIDDIDLAIKTYWA